MAQTLYFNEELARLRLVWVSAVQRHDTNGVRDASTAYFHRARELAADNPDASADDCSRQDHSDA